MTTTPAALRAEFTLQRKKLQTNPQADLHKELVFNVYPCLEALAEQLQEQDKALQEFEESGSYLLPEDSQLLVAAFMSIDALLTEVRKIEIKDDIQKKRIVDLADEAEKLCTEAVLMVNDSTLEEEYDEDEDEDTDEDEGESSEAEEQ